MADAAEQYDDENIPASVNGMSPEVLRDMVRRIENLEQQKVGIQEDIKAVYGEAKSEGFDVKTIREIIKLRKKDEQTVEQEELLLMTYKRALGMKID